MSDKFDYSTLETGFVADWPVKVPTPVKGVFVEQTFTARFKSLDTDEIAEILKPAGATIHDLMRVYFVGLGEGEAATWSPELRDKMMRNPRTFNAIHLAFREFNTGAAPGN